MQIAALPAFAQEEPSVILETDQKQYQTGDTMTISGFVEEKKMPVVALQIFDPDNTILTANQLDIDEENSFSKEISLESPFYEKPGTYTISVNYGKLASEIYFDIVTETETEDEVELDDLVLLPEILFMFTDKEVYQDGDTVTLIGLVSEKSGDSALVGIYDPFGTPAGFYFGDIDDNFEFSVSFLVKDGVNFKTEGTYSVSAFYGESEETTSFEYVKNLEPEQTQEPEQEKTQADTTEQKEKQAKPVEEKPAAKKSSSTEKKSSEKKITEQTIQNKKPQTKEEAKPAKTPTDNLSVEDIELGIMLNQINLNCDTNELTDMISYYDSMGPALIRLCKYADAIYYYDQSLLNDPANVDILTNKGSALAKMGFYNEAIIHYNSALAKEPNNYLALNNKANALSNLGRHDEALLLYDKALLMAPTNTVILNNLDISQQQNQEKASQQAVSATEVQPVSSNNVQKPEQNLVKSNNQEAKNIFDQIGDMFSSLFALLP